VYWEDLTFPRQPLTSFTLPLGLYSRIIISHSTWPGYGCVASSKQHYYEQSELPSWDETIVQSGCIPNEPQVCWRSSRVLTRMLAERWSTKVKRNRSGGYWPSAFSRTIWFRSDIEILASTTRLVQDWKIALDPPDQKWTTKAAGALPKSWSISKFQAQAIPFNVVSIITTSEIQAAIHEPTLRWALHKTHMWKYAVPSPIHYRGQAELYMIGIFENYACVLYWREAWPSCRD
jgi:hypothetical protein